MLPQVGAEVSTWRVVGGGRCETGVAAGWQRGGSSSRSGQRAAVRVPPSAGQRAGERRRGRGSCSHTQILRSTGSLLASGSPCLGRAGPPGNHNNLVVLDNVSLVWETLSRWLAWGAFSSGRELAGRTTSASHPFSGGGRV